MAIAKESYGNINTNPLFCMTDKDTLWRLLFERKGNFLHNILKPIRSKTIHFRKHTVSVPLFINEGEVLRIDTRTGAYIERVK